MKKYKIILLTIIFPFYTAYGQTNMVLNGDFENITGCPMFYITAVIDWQGLSGTCDFYSWANSCGPTFNAIPPSSGSGGNCIGFLLNEAREYPSGKLDCPMIKDKCYRVRFKYRADEVAGGGTGWFSNNLGVLFSTTVPNSTPNTWQPIITTPSLNISTIIYPGSWHDYEGYYTAAGGEKFITIGNFYSIANTQTIQGPFGNSSGGNAYMFIDAIEVIAIDSDNRYIENTVYPSPTNHTIEAGNSIYAGYAVDGNGNNNGNVTVNNGANVTYRAGRKILLEPGFKANDYFHAYISPFCDNDYNAVTADAGEDVTLYYQDASCVGVGDVCYQIGEDLEPGFSYSWSPQSGLSNSTVSNPTVCYDASLQYPVTYVVTKTNGCVTVYDSITVSIGTPSPSGWSNPHPGTCIVYVTPNFGTPPYTYLWSNGNTTSSFASIPTNWPEDFTVVITDANGLQQKVCILNTCSGALRLITEINSNIEPIGELNLSISPNPNNGQFNVSIDNEGGAVTIQVFDVMGKQVYSENAMNNSFSINISDQPRGVYLVKLTVGDQLFTEKIIYQ